MRGEDISVGELASEYGVSQKSISRNISDLKSFLADHRELVGNTQLEYSHKNKCYRLRMDEFLTNKELFSIAEVLIGARAFSRMELLTLIDKLKKFTTAEDRPKLNELIRKEIYHYPEVKHDCDSVEDLLWQIRAGEQPFTARVSSRSKARAGDVIKVAIDPNKIHIFDRDTERYIVH